MEEQTPSPLASADTPISEQPPIPIKRPIPAGFQVVPYFVSALFFFSFVFAVFAPFPLLLLYLRGGIAPLLIAVVTNSLIVGILGGSSFAGVYFVSVGLLSILLPFLLFERRLLPDRTVFLTLLAMLASGVGMIWIHFALKHQAPLPALKAMLEANVDKVLALSDGNNDWMGDMTPDELKQSMMTEFPSLVVVFALLMAWLNTVLLCRLQPVKLKERLGIDRTYFREWKAPEWLVWPTIAIGGAYIFTQGMANSIALNILKFLMVVYGMQGLSLIVFVLDHLKVRGFFRTLVYLITTLFMAPILAGFGFFDLWFDFRSKFRQS